MFLAIKYLSLVLVISVVVIFASGAELRAAQRDALALEPGPAQRKAILDTLREEIKRRHGREVVFVVRNLNVLHEWAWLNAVSRSPDGNHEYGDVSGLLGKRGAAWEVIELPCNDADIPTCVGNADYFTRLKERFPLVPAELFTGSKTQAVASSKNTATSHTGAVPGFAVDSIKFDREFRGLADDGQIPAAMKSTPEPLREQLESADSRLQSMADTVKELQSNRQELASKLIVLDAELDKQRQAAAEAHSARHELVSALSGLRDEVTALTDSVATIETNQQTVDPSIVDLRNELTNQGDAAQRFDARSSAMQSELAAITAQVSDVRSAQQRIVDDGVASRQQATTRNTTTQTQLQSIEKSLQELHNDRGSLIADLAKVSEELTHQGQTLAESKTARDTLISELATKQSLNEIAAAQKQLTVEGSATHEKLQSIDKSLQELDRAGQYLTAELAKLSLAFDQQVAADTRSNAAREALVTELNNIRNTVVIADAAIKTALESRKDLDSQLSTLQQEMARRGETFSKSESVFAEIRAELASMNEQVKYLRTAQQSTIDQTAQSQQELKQEVNSVRAELTTIVNSLQPASNDIQDVVSDAVTKMEQELAKQRQLLAQSNTDRRKLASEVSALSSKLSALDTANQAAQMSRNQLNAEFNALRQEVGTTKIASTQLHQEPAMAGTDIASSQPANVDTGNGTSAGSIERPDLQLASVEPVDERGPASAPHPPTPRTQPGSRGTWKITPVPGQSDGRFTHRASGTITRLPALANVPETTGNETYTRLERNAADETPSSIGGIEPPAMSTAPPEGSQVAGITNTMDLNSLSDFDAIDPFLQAWTEDWERRDLEAYLAHYSSEFQPSNGLNRATWRDQRRNSLLKPAFIDVNLNNIQKRSTGAASAQLTFYQTYRSNIYSDQVVKILDLRWEDERWKILKEESQSPNSN